MIKAIDQGLNKFSQTDPPGAAVPAPVRQLAKVNVESPQSSSSPSMSAESPQTATTVNAVTSRSPEVYVS